MDPLVLSLVPLLEKRKQLRWPRSVRVEWLKKAVVFPPKKREQLASQLAVLAMRLRKTEPKKSRTAATQLLALIVFLLEDTKKIKQLALKAGFAQDDVKKLLDQKKTVFEESDPDQGKKAVAGFLGLLQNNKAGKAD